MTNNARVRLVIKVKGMDGFWRRGLSVLVLAGLSFYSFAAQAQSLCIYDPMGAQGDYFSLARDYQLEAKLWGVKIILRPYLDDNALIDAFKAGKCDMASMIGMHARQYNQFTGTLDAPGVLDSYAEVRDAMAVMASPKLAKYMLSNGYEVVGVMPIGASYPVVRDRSINSLERAAGKKVVVMKFDKTQPMLAEDYKAIPVAVDPAKMGDAFNKGEVDVFIAPMVLYKPMELYKGIGTTGGIVRRPLFELSMQVLVHSDKFPADFGQKSREYILTQTDHALGIIHNQEADVDPHFWIYAMHNELTEWKTNMRSTLEHLTKAGYFDRHMLALLKRVRCKEDAQEPDCTPTPDQQPAAAATHP